MESINYFFIFRMKFLRTIAQLRKDFNIDLNINKDSEYKEIVREPKVFPNLMISKNLEQSLPFKAKNKVKSAVKGKSINFEDDDTFLLKKLNLPHNKPIKNYHTEKEKNISAMIQRLQTIKNEKEKKTKLGEIEYNKKIKEEEDSKLKLQKKRQREKMMKNIKNKNNK